MVLRQGMKRQIRKMFYALGYEVQKLVRVRIGPLEIEKMPPGAMRALTQKEIEALLASGVSTEEASPRPAPHRRPVRRPAFARRAEDAPRPERPRRPAPSHASPAARGGRGSVEEIPFVPRANRPEHREERPQKARPFARSTGKPAGKFGAKSWDKPKPWARKPHTEKAKPAAKPGPRPFAKFERRRPGE